MHRYEARILDSDGPNRFDLVPTDNPLERKWELQVPPALRPLPSHPPHCLPARPTVQRSVQRSAQYTVHNTPCNACAVTPSLTPTRAFPPPPTPTPTPNPNPDPTPNPTPCPAAGGNPNPNPNPNPNLSPAAGGHALRHGRLARRAAADARRRTRPPRPHRGPIARGARAPQLSLGGGGGVAGRQPRVSSGRVRRDPEEMTSRAHCSQP